LFSSLLTPKSDEPHGARWELEYFRLDEASEKKLRRDAMMSAAKARRA